MNHQPDQPRPRPDGTQHDRPGPVTHCSACGRAFGKRAAFTVAQWFNAGTPPRLALVHVGCRHKPLSRYPQFSRPAGRAVPAWLHEHELLEAERSARRQEAERRENRRRLWIRRMRLDELARRKAAADTSKPASVPIAIVGPLVADVVSVAATG